MDKIKPINIGEKVDIFKFNIKNGKRPKCSMCDIEIAWHEVGIKIISSQMTGHLAFHQDCFDEFLGRMIEAREILR